MLVGRVNWALSVAMTSLLAIGVLAGCAAPVASPVAVPELTKQRVMYLQGHQIIFGCDGTTGLYREQVYSWAVTAVPNHVDCL